jgi:hypothetical protein
MKTLIGLITACLLMSMTGIAHAQDADGAFDIDTRFRSRIAKEKAKQAALNSLKGKSGKDATVDSSECGSQNIGNLDLNGRPGSQPREVFVFAPNAINLVGSGACR